MNEIKILHVIARMNVGGTAKYVSDLLSKFPNSALATGYVQGMEIEDDGLKNLQVFRIPHLGRRISLRNDYLAWKELRKLVREFDPDVLHTHTFKAGLVGRLIPGRHKRVHTFHGHLFHDRSFNPIEIWVIKIVERYLARRTDILISVGEKVGVQMRSAGIGRRNKWLSVPPGIQMPKKIERTEARKLLKLDSKDFLVGWMGRMVSVKNPMSLITIAQLLPEITFVMAGGGDLLDEVTLRAPTNVLVKGWVDSNHFWSAVDCAISTSTNEGMPIALIEAQMSGIPVIATDVGSNAEVIENGITGLITEENVNSQVEALKYLISNTQVFDAMCRASQENSPTKFGLKKMLESHQKIYLELFEAN